MTANITYSEYWQEVRALALAVINEVNQQCSGCDFSDGEYVKAEQACNELTTEHEWVIYLYKAKQVMIHTDNLNAWFENEGVAIVNNAEDFFHIAAAYALCADVWDMLCRMMADRENAA